MKYYIKTIALLMLSVALFGQISLNNGLFSSGHIQSDNSNFKVGGVFGQVASGESTNSNFKVISGFASIASINTNIEQNIDKEMDYYLFQNYPNPFNPMTKLNFRISEISPVKMTIYNILGQKIYEWDFSNLSAGNYSLIWNAKDIFGHTVESGMYLYTLMAGDFVETKKMVFMK